MTAKTSKTAKLVLLRSKLYKNLTAVCSTEGSFSLEVYKRETPTQNARSQRAGWFHIKVRQTPRLTIGPFPSRRRIAGGRDRDRTGDPPACKSAWLCPSYLESSTYVRCDSRYSVRFGLYWSALGTICVRIRGVTCAFATVFLEGRAPRRILVPRREERCVIAATDESSRISPDESFHLWFGGRASFRI